MAHWSSFLHLSRLCRAVVALCILSAGVNCAAQQPKVPAPHKPVAPKLPRHREWDKPAAPQSLAGGFWMTDGNFKATLYLNNTVKTDPVTATPIVHLSNGVQYALPPITLEPSGTAVISINQALAAQGLAPYATLSGYVEVQYQWPWAALCGTVWNVDTAHSLIFVYGLWPPSAAAGTQEGEARAHEAQVFEGVWWKQESNVTGFVALSNVTARPINARMQVLDNEGQTLGEHTVTVSPQGSKMVELNELLSAAATMGGVIVTHDGRENELVVNASLKDESAGYSARLPLRSPPPAASNVTEDSYTELGLMSGEADPMMSFPAGTLFTPYSVLRNLSGQPVTVAPTLWWMQGGVARSAQIPQLTLAPHQTQKLDLPALLAAAGLRNFNGSVNLVLDAKGQQGALLLAGGSVDRRNTYVFEVIPRTLLESAAKGLPFWSTANGDDTMVTLWNPADEEQELVFTLSYTGGHYAYPIRLAPRATMSFNVSEIVHNQIPDAEGNVVPTAVRFGSAELSGAQGENEHILVAMDGGIYNVQKATCGSLECANCTGIVSTFVNVNPFAVGVGKSTQQTFGYQYNTGSQYDVTSTSNWSSSNTSVATVNQGLTNGVSVGSVTLSAIYPYTEPAYTNPCSYNGPPNCPPAYFQPSGSAPGNSNPTVTFSGTPVVPLGGTAPITATVTPANNTTSITLTLSTITGTGSAIFAGGQTTMTITNTTIVTIVGVAGSSTPNNIQLSASIPSEGAAGTLATTTFTVATTNGAIPVNFRQVGVSQLSNGVLQFVYEWDSSTGNSGDLANCNVGEIVSYPSSAWNSPPYSKSDPNFNYSNPFTSSILATNVLVAPYNHTGFADQHAHPAFLTPYKADNFTATQYYRFQCTYY
jgi:hypothetical protein